MNNIVWVVLGVGLAGVLAKRIASADRPDTLSRLGFVSHQWLAEHRVGQVSDPSGDR